jgi:2-oxoglutarate ferredoxin oxidoreductase subunit delta
VNVSSLGNPRRKLKSARRVDFLAKKFDVVINKKWCKGCGLCIGICPKKVLELDRTVKSEPVRPDDCIGCRQCENICPDLAITVGERE